MNLHRPRESSVSLPVPLKGSLLGDNHGHARGALILWPSLWPVFKSTAVSPAHPPRPVPGSLRTAPNLCTHPLLDLGLSLEVTSSCKPPSWMRWTQSRTHSRPVGPQWTLGSGVGEKVAGSAHPQGGQHGTKEPTQDLPPGRESGLCGWGRGGE